MSSGEQLQNGGRFFLQEEKSRVTATAITAGLDNGVLIKSHLILGEE
jgi:hypothetical protein